MSRTLLAGGCSFTFGHELSDDKNGKKPSALSWSALLAKEVKTNYSSVAYPGTGNAGIARRVFEYITNNKDKNLFVAIMWTFTSRYDWAMPRHAMLEKTRWATITPWDTNKNQAEVEKELSHNKAQYTLWKVRKENMKETNVLSFADALYQYAANQYHETYLSWKNIVWLQNILEKKKIPYFFTLADNTLFWDEFKALNEIDSLLNGLYNEIDFSRWYVFGERQMGFNQWASLNEYSRGTTHPLDAAHIDAAKLMKDKFLELYNKQ
jgi:hypothetical protein